MPNEQIELYIKHIHSLFNKIPALNLKKESAYHQLCYKMGVYCLDYKHEYDTGEKYLLDILPLLQEGGMLYYNTISRLFSIYCKKKDFPQAEQNLNKMKELVANQDFLDLFRDSTEVEIDIKICEGQLLQKRYGYEQHGRCITIFEQECIRTIRDKNKTGYEKQQATCYHYLSTIYLSKAHYYSKSNNFSTWQLFNDELSRCVFYIKEAICFRRKLGQIKELIRSLEILGKAHKFWKDNNKNIVSFREAIEPFKEAIDLRTKNKIYSKDCIEVLKGLVEMLEVENRLFYEKANLNEFFTKVKEIYSDNDVLQKIEAKLMTYHKLDEDTTPKHGIKRNKSFEDIHQASRSEKKPKKNSEERDGVSDSELLNSFSERVTKNNLLLRAGK